MKIGELKELEDGGLDIEFIFDSKDEEKFYIELADKENLSLNDFFIKMIDEYSKETIKKNE